MPARLLGMCLGEDVVVLAGYMLTGPTFLLITSRGCYGGRINYRSGTVNSNTVNSKFHLIRSCCEYLARFLSFHV